METHHAGKGSAAEILESHQQFNAAWSLYARTSEGGEVAGLDGLSIANARQPWYLTNGAILTKPVTSREDLSTRVGAAINYFAAEKCPWFFFGGEQWLGEGASETLSALGFAEAFKVVGMVAEQLAPPERPLPEVELRRIADETGRWALADLNADAYHITPDWVRGAVTSESLWKTPLYGYNAYVDGKPVCTGFGVPLNGVIYMAYVATAMAHRRKGLAELLMRRCLEQASRETGITRTVLHATADGYPVYLKMGYRPVEQFTIYVPQ
jgi:GNAT superfamily N-acetyltransferase